MSSLAHPAFPASAAFDAINAAINSDPADRDDAIKSAKSVFSFTLTNEKGATESWYIDLKDKGVVGKGAAPAGGKADVTLQLSDADFASLVSGKANAQRLFMAGKLKIKGNVMKATKMEPILKKAQGKAKL
ncbi:oleate-induced peroxisomal protein [Histoplasma capsulatum G186AR]|uniref:Oleate-induced peroxisomal protein n=2 Tax=Ajellomyces capsulatus TaxID=5037 RepID=C0NHE2_AJECG|nr:oleate-induced peroxisomal protein [Histoplasma capsulatum G186AR]EEH09227.1 oleate-induced peroxisomal protein [Histoplasma capsulatum G186AR]KAG5303436.1 oleate-induced peroxisomal protein [Histoplasma capsulatum]QSS69033.1 oleate-induced peroxisomal protein [Histoplasma capsulatum G186AR]